MKRKQKNKDAIEAPTSMWTLTVSQNYKCMNVFISPNVKLNDICLKEKYVRPNMYFSTF